MKLIKSFSLSLCLSFFIRIYYDSLSTGISVFLSVYLLLSLSPSLSLSPLFCVLNCRTFISFQFNSVIFFSKRFSSRCSSQMKTLNLTVCQWKPFEKLKSWKAENPPVRSVFIFCKVLIIFIQIFCFKLKGNFCCLNIRKI